MSFESDKSNNRGNENEEKPKTINKEFVRKFVERMNIIIV